jgi:tetratricopeptide (TPR) repeat protein
LKLVSTTLSGNAQDTIADALRSVVEHVDAAILIDTGITDRTVEIAREVCGSKLHVRSFPWCQDFAAARNASAKFAAELPLAESLGEPVWQIFVDTDERMQNMDAVRKAIEEDSGIYEYYLVTHHSESHERERIFKLPIKGTWSGRTHEAYCNGGPAAKMPRLRTFELVKNDSALQHKFKRDEDMLRIQTAETPLDPRWWYYLGDALQNQRKFREAIDAYHRCVSLDGWPEEGAWACFKAGICHAELGELNQTVRCAARGLSVHPGFAELAWMAGWACAKLGQQQHAYAWARMSEAMGAFKGRQKDQNRIGFKHIPGLWEGPYDILRFTAPTPEERAAAEAEFERARLR